MIAVSHRMLFVLLIILNISCSQEDQFSPGISVEARVASSLNFSGYSWTVRNTGNVLSGPGANYFSGNKKNVFVDNNGLLHLEIQKKNNKWYCSEVLSNDNMGYGTYTFVTQSIMENFDRNIVVGLFTWDDDDYQTQANSELDVEFARWGDPRQAHVLDYSVQPTRGGLYTERALVPNSPLQYDAENTTTHIIIWTPDSVRFETHKGDDTSPSTLTQHFTFTKDNPPRTADENGVISDPIIIPAPGNATKAHMNFWLFDTNQNGKGDPPSNGQNAELIVKRFSYVAG